MIVRSQKRPGLSLLEVVLSMGIFLIALAAISQLIDLGSTAALEADLQNTAIRLAQSKLAEVEAGSLAVTGGDQGIWEEDELWEWQILPSVSVATNTYEVTVVVKYTSPVGLSQPFQYQMTQIIFDPYSMGNASEAQPPEPVEAPTEGTNP